MPIFKTREWQEINHYSKKINKSSPLTKLASCFGVFVVLFAFFNKSGILPWRKMGESESNDLAIHIMNPTMNTVGGLTPNR